MWSETCSTPILRIIFNTPDTVIIIRLYTWHRDLCHVIYLTQWSLSGYTLDTVIHIRLYAWNSDHYPVIHLTQWSLSGYTPETGIYNRYYTWQSDHYPVYSGIINQFYSCETWSLIDRKPEKPMSNRSFCYCMYNAVLHLLIELRLAMWFKSIFIQQINYTFRISSWRTKLNYLITDV